MPEPAVSVLDGSNFVVSDHHGDVRPDNRLPPHGFFSEDTRFVSCWMLSVQGQPTDTLSQANLDYSVAQFFLTSPALPFHSAPGLGIVRRRLLGDEWMEELVVVNHCDETVAATIGIDVATDFADLFEVKDDLIRQRQVEAIPGDRGLRLRYENGAFVRETRISVSEDVSVDDASLRINLWLDPREEHRISLVISPHAHRSAAERPRRRSGSFEDLRRERTEELEQWVSQAPGLQAGDDTLCHLYRRSLMDLAALRFYPHVAAQDASLPAAGLPWFMTLFGRDSLITSYQVLPYRPDLARTTLGTLAARQGTVRDDFRDEEPGKILHEIRFGELTYLGEQPHSPYYGTADATPLLLIVLDEYERWTGDTSLVRALEPAARAALRWIDREGDLDGDGYVEYQTRNPRSGLVNQCWKDSWNSMLFTDGRIAEGPMASCEIQGYVYDAKRRSARLAREVWSDPALAGRLEVEADALAARMREDFWIPERACFALALDGEKRQVDSLCSNMGHLLWSGVVDADRAEAVVAHLMGEPLYSGWGIRTMGDAEGGYNPLSYHNGSVWPHDNSLIAAGLRRYGYADEAARVAGDLVEAAQEFDHRLPEVFAGCARSLTDVPVAYPTASSPQAWAAGAPLLLLTTVLGLVPSGADLHSAPHPPLRFGDVRLSGLRGPWGTAEVEAEAGPAAVAS